MFLTVCKLLSYVYHGRKILKHKKIHLVDGHWAHFGGVVAFILAKILSVKFIVTVYGTEPSLIFFKKYIELATDGVLTISNYTRSKLSRSAMVIYPLVDPNLFYPGKVSRSRKPYQISTLGFIRKRKGFDDLIKAFSLVARECSESSLVIGGGGDARVLKEIGRALGVENKVLFKDYIPDEELVEFYRACDIFVLPSIEEGFGLVVAEAMACGKPVVVSDGGALPEVVGDCGIVVPRHNAEILGITLIQLLLDEKKRIKLGEAARKRAIALFSPEKIIPRLESLYSAFA